MKTLLTSSLIIACSAALIACGGSSSSSDNKAANNSSGGPGSGSSSGVITTSNAFKSAEGAAVAASAASGMIGMAQELATGDGFGSEEETTPASDIPAAISGDFDTDEACDVGRIRTTSGFVTSRFDFDLNTEIFIAENCQHQSPFEGDNSVSTMNGRMEVGEEPSLGLSYVRATGLDNSLTEGFYFSENNFMGPLKQTMRALIETKEVHPTSEVHAYAVMDMDMFGTKMRMNMGNSASEPLVMIATAINNDEEEIKVDGHLAAAFDEAGNCSFAVNYTTIEPLVQNINDEDALPTAGELTIALVGDKSYNVKFDNAGILVDGKRFTEEDIDNSELAKQCGEFMDDDDDDMPL